MKRWVFACNSSGYWTFAAVVQSQMDDISTRLRTKSSQWPLKFFRNELKLSFSLDSWHLDMWNNVFIVVLVLAKRQEINWLQLWLSASPSVKTMNRTGRPRMCLVAIKMRRLLDTHKTEFFCCNCGQEISLRLNAVKCSSLTELVLFDVNVIKPVYASLLMIQQQNLY